MSTPSRRLPPPIRRVTPLTQEQFAETFKCPTVQVDSPPQEEPRPSGQVMKGSVVSKTVRENFNDLTVLERRGIFQYLRFAMARRELQDVLLTLEPDDNIDKGSLAEVIRSIERMEEKLYSHLSLESAGIPPRSGISTRGPIK